MQEEIQNIEQLLEQGYAIQIRPQGTSMMPFIDPKRDMVVIEKTDPAKAKRGDVLLYRRIGGILVLHRVYRHRDGELYMLGDNQTVIEGPIMEDQIRGKMTALVRDGRIRSAEDLRHRGISHFWLLLRLFRPYIYSGTLRIKKIFSGK